jgi:uncharacterized membrane protein
MSASCLSCGAEVENVNSPCPECGESSPSAISLLTPPERFAAAFAYFALIPAIIFLLLTRFKANRFVRFHSFQSIFLAVAIGLLAVALRLLFLVSFIPFLSAALIVAIACLGCFVLWIVLLVKAFQGRTFKLPLIGDLARKQANG